MTDLLGPASSLNAVSQRPSDGRNFGSLDTWFRDCTTPASQDGTQVTAGWLNGVMGLFRSAIRGNGLKADGVTPVVAEDQSDGMLLGSINQLFQRGQATYGIDVGAPDALVISPVGTPAVEYKAGMVFRVRKGTAANATTTPTLNVSGLGAVAIRRFDGSSVAAGDLPAGGGLTVWFDGASFRLIGLARSNVVDIIASTGTAPICFVADAGTADALSGPGSPTIAAYGTGQVFVVAKNTAVAANTTTTPTLAVGNLPAKTIVKANGTALAAGDLPAGAEFIAIYDGTNIRLLAPTASDIAGAAYGLEKGWRVVQYAVASSAGATYTATDHQRIEVDVTNGPATINLPAPGANVQVDVIQRGTSAYSVTFNGPLSFTGGKTDTSLVMTSDLQGSINSFGFYADGSFFRVSMAYTA